MHPFWAVMGVHGCRVSARAWAASGLQAPNSALHGVALRGRALAWAAATRGPRVFLTAALAAPVYFFWSGISDLISSRVRQDISCCEWLWAEGAKGDQQPRPKAGLPFVVTVC